MISNILIWSYAILLLQRCHCISQLLCYGPHLPSADRHLKTVFWACSARFASHLSFRPTSRGCLSWWQYSHCTHMVIVGYWWQKNRLRKDCSACLSGNLAVSNCVFIVSKTALDGRNTRTPALKLIGKPLASPHIGHGGKIKRSIEQFIKVSAY